VNEEVEHMACEVIVDNISREDWERYAGDFADYSIYQTWPYQQVRADMAFQQVSRFIIKDENGEVVTMGQVRTKHFKPLRLKIGYIQRGPLMCSKNGTLKCSPEVLSLLCQAYLGSKLSILRLVPNIYNGEKGRHITQMFESGGFALVPQMKLYHTFVLRLDASEEELRRNLRSSWRGHLRQAEKVGLKIKEGTNHEYFSVFEALYQSTMERKDFKGLDLQEFSRTHLELNDLEKMKFVIAYYDEQPVYANVLSCIGDTAIYLLAAGNNLGRQLRASYLTWWRALLTARKAGMEYCDLGGIDPVNNTGVYMFKRGLGGVEALSIGAFEACSSVIVKNVWRAAEKVYRLIKK